jgi:hypothetical protein
VVVEHPVEKGADDGRRDCGDEVDQGDRTDGT